MCYLHKWPNAVAPLFAPLKVLEPLAMKSRPHALTHSLACNLNSRRRGHAVDLLSASRGDFWFRQPLIDMWRMILVVVTCLIRQKARG